MMEQRLRANWHWIWLLSMVIAIAAGCSEPTDSSKSGSGERIKPMSYGDAEKDLAKLRAGVNAAEVQVGQVELLATPSTSIEDTLPDIATFPLVVNPVEDDRSVVAEVFASTEKSGSGTDGWMVEVGEQFNQANRTTSSGRLARIAVRKIASGTAYEFIASRKYVPDGFSPSNDLWVEMARAQGADIGIVTDRLADNIAGLVMKKTVADKLKPGKPQITVADLVEAAIQGKIVVGYTNPFASSTGLNFLVTVLQTFARGEESSMLSPDVASAFENFQKSVPFVALTTMQMRDSVEKDRSLEAFVLEYQTFVQTPSLRSGYVFIPFGFRHDSPLCTVGRLKPEKREVLELFAKFAHEAQARKLAAEYGFNPPIEWKAPFKLPSGRMLIEAQRLWKQKKDAGRPIAAVFVADVSGSMAGTKIQQLRRALIEGGSFIVPENAIGLVSFASNVSILLPVRPFQLVQKSAFQTVARHLEAEGNTAMYDGIIVALSMLAEYKKSNPDVRPMLFVLTDGLTNRGLNFEEVVRVITGMRIPIYTIGFEADVKELSRLSSLVEAASLSASEADLRYKIGALLNSQM
jgi:Ca-activated chloride channel homolog